MKKKEGSVDKIAIALMSMMIGAVMIFTSIESAHVMDKKSEITSMVRQHILYMESNGSLTAGQISKLQKDIENLGVKIKEDDIKVSSGVTYGGEIFIEVSGFITLRSYNPDDTERSVDLPFRVRRSSIAKND